MERRKRSARTWPDVAILRMSVLLAALAGLMCSRPAAAQWQPQGVAVCAVAGDQVGSLIVSDGAGGAIVAWLDDRTDLGSLDYDVYAQHLLASGATDPIWPADGLAVCTASGGQNLCAIASDGLGGAFISWMDNRTVPEVLDTYVQHVLASGAVDPAWPIDGRAVCPASHYQAYSQVVSDGSGGAIVAWVDARDGSASRIYAQHLLSFGTVDPAWPAEGRALCIATEDQRFACMVSDGSGGAVVTWVDARIKPGEDLYTDIYAQHVLASGALDPMWPVDGRAVCAAPYSQDAHQVVSDGAGGGIVTWQDYRSLSSLDIYAQHLLVSGALDPAWPVDGLAVCTAIGTQMKPVIATDGAGGGVLTWMDSRSNSGLGIDLYAQHVLASGTVDPVWPADGRAVCTANDIQRCWGNASDGSGGVIVAWQDDRSLSSHDVYAERVLASGAVDPAWPLDGAALCTGTNHNNDQWPHPAIVADGMGGAIVVWQDFRSGTNWDIYAQHVTGGGAFAVGVAELAQTGDRLLTVLAPNPMTAGVVIAGELPTRVAADVLVIDVLGRVVRALTNTRELGPGKWSLSWDGRNQSGTRVPPGVYLVRLSLGSVSVTRRLAVVW